MTVCVCWCLWYLCLGCLVTKEQVAEIRGKGRGEEAIAKKQGLQAERSSGWLEPQEHGTGVGGGSEPDAREREMRQKLEG